MREKRCRGAQLSAGGSGACAVECRAWTVADKVVLREGEDVGEARGGRLERGGGGEETFRETTCWQTRGC
jgi:hypothetical protein